MSVGKRKYSDKPTEALSLPGLSRITIVSCYSVLFTHRFAPELFYDALRQQSLLP